MSGARAAQHTGMRAWKYRILPLMAIDGPSFELVIHSETETNARRQAQSQFSADRYQLAFLGEIR
jgi:hypothetical protein